MIRHKPISLLVLLCSLFASCKQSFDRDEYIQWVQDYKNGLHVKKTFSDFIFDLQYQPKGYSAVLNNMAPVAETPTLEYFTLRISTADPHIDPVSYGVNTTAEKQKNLYYFSYLFQEDLYLEVEGKRFPCVLFHSESTDLKKVKTFVLGFEVEPGDKESGPVTFIIDSPKFSSLPIRINIIKEDIPTLKI